MCLLTQTLRFSFLSHLRFPPPFGFLKAVSVKVYVRPEKTTPNGYVFNLMCPGYAFNKFYEKVFMSNDGVVLNNGHFFDYCKEKHIFIATNQEEEYMLLNEEGQYAAELFPVSPVCCKYQFRFK